MGSSLRAQQLGGRKQHGQKKKKFHLLAYSAAPGISRTDTSSASWRKTSTVDQARGRLKPLHLSLVFFLFYISYIDIICLAVKGKISWLTYGA